MTLKAAFVPLHWRHESSQARIAIKQRYRIFKLKMSRQVVILQKSVVFRSQCLELYERGYKDWMILGTVYNQLLQLQLIEQGIDILDGPRAAEVARNITENAMPFNVDTNANRFCGDEFMRFLYHFNFMALAAYGFELGRQMLHTKTVESFLRDRLGYFEMDLAHTPLFGERKGSWPDSEIV